MSDNHVVRQIVDSMSLDEKIRLLAGRDAWHTQPIESASLPSVMLTDGPHGLRKQEEGFGLNGSIPSTCFPPACLMAASWDEVMVESVGSAIGEECAAEDVSIILGPGVNIKRSPLCGRNFEYYSEDPYLAGKMGAAFIRGVQKNCIGTSLKHFAANNQEKARMSSNSIIDERALREIYLKPFEIAVRESQPATVMCSYNMINGVYSCENGWLLSDVLRDEWGFEGLVMTDWGAMDDRVEATLACLDLEMPGPSPMNEKKIRKALEDGALSIEDIDKCVSRIVSMVMRGRNVEKKPYSVDAHHKSAHDMAASSFVLLENDGALPLGNGRYSLIGALAEKPRYQGAGSSRINPTKLDSIRDSLAASGMAFDYAPGYDAETGSTDDKLIADALRVSEGKDAAIVIIGLPESYESEGFDRKHMDLPSGEIRLVEAFLDAGVPVIAAVLAGSPVILPFRKRVSSLLFCYLGGQAVGSALADVLSGRIAPSGKLAETFPLAVEDTPCFGSFATDDRNVEYRESIFVGYRYYDWAGKEVAYPFGYGLSYTSFSLHSFDVRKDGDDVAAGLSVRNTGEKEGEEVVQIYIGLPGSHIMRPVRELRAFRKVRLAPGEEERIEIRLSPDSFSYYDTELHSFEIEDGEYIIYAGTSSRDLPLSASIRINGRKEAHGAYAERGRLPSFESLFHKDVPRIKADGGITLNSTISEVLETEAGKAIIAPIVKEAEKAYKAIGGDVRTMMLSMLRDMPLRALSMNSGLDVQAIYEALRGYGA